MWLVHIENFNSLLFFVFVLSTGGKPADTEHLLFLRGLRQMFLGILCVGLWMRGLCPGSSKVFYHILMEKENRVLVPFC